MVTSGSLRRSTRPSRSAALTSGSTIAASRITSAGHSCGRSWLAIAISTSSDGCRRSPSTERISPSGPRCWLGGSVISTTTIWPARGVLLLAGRNQDVLVQAAIVRRHQGDAVLDQHAADQARRTTLQHLDDGALAAAATIDADHAGQHAVAVHHGAHLLRRKIKVVAALVRAQEAVALDVGDHRAGNQVELLRRGVVAAPALQQLAIAHHRAEALAHRQQVGFVDTASALRRCAPR